MANSDEIFKVPGGNFCVFKDEMSVEYDEFDRPVLSVNVAGGAGEVKSVNGKKGRVQLTTDDIPDGTNTKQLTNELKQKILDNETHITILDNEMGDVQRDVATNSRDITAVRTALQSKQDLITGAASTAVENNFDADKLVVTNAAGKLESSIRGTEVFVPNGGQTNQVLMKNSADDYDVKWADATQAQIPVNSVNTKTGDVVLTQDDVGNGQEFVQTHNDFTDADKTQVDTNKTDIATIKQQITTINTKLNQKVAKSGDTMTGSLTLNGAPTTNNMAATKKYVDDKLADALPTHTVNDENKVLSVDGANNPVWRETKEVPVSTQADANKVLAVGATGEPTWVNSPPSQNGIPVGGAVGQILVKKDGTDYNAEWKDPDGISFGNTLGNKNVVTDANGKLSTEDKLLEKPQNTDVGKAPVVQNDGTLAYERIVGTIRDGGNEGEVLIKKSGTDYDTEWANYIPKYGSTGDILVKSTNNNYSMEWKNLKPQMVPAGGGEGYVLAKNSKNDYATVWVDISKKVMPTGGTAEQVLAKTNAADYNVKWKTVNSVPESTTADAGKVLSVNKQGTAEWAASTTKNIELEMTSSAQEVVSNVIAYEPQNTIGFFRSKYDPTLDPSAAQMAEKGFSMYTNYGMTQRQNYYDFYNFCRGAIRWSGEESNSIWRKGLAVVISAGIPDNEYTKIPFVKFIIRNGHCYANFTQIKLTYYSGYTQEQMNAFGFKAWIRAYPDAIPEVYRPTIDTYGSFFHGEIKIDTDGFIYFKYIENGDGKTTVYDCASQEYTSSMAYPTY